MVGPESHAKLLEIVGFFFHLGKSRCWKNQNRIPMCVPVQKQMEGWWLILVVTVTLLGRRSPGTTSLTVAYGHIYVAFS